MSEQNDETVEQVLGDIAQEVAETEENTNPPVEAPTAKEIAALEEGEEVISSIESSVENEDVKKNLSEMEQVSLDVGKSLEELKKQIETLNKVFDDEKVNMLDPKTTLQSESGGGGEYDGFSLNGGTFAVDGGVHKTLAGGLETASSMLGGDYDIEGAGYGNRSIESKVLRKVNKRGSAISDGLKKVEEGVSTRIHAIHSLKNVMNGSINKLLDIINTNDSNGVASNNARIVKAVHDKLNTEFDNQVGHLQNILKVKVKPVKEDLMSLLKDNNNFQALADKLGVGYNTQEASDRLALAYTNLSKLQILAKHVESALKTLEISLDKYKSLKSLEELRKVLADTLKNTTGRSTEGLSKVLSAINTLKNAHPNHGKVIKELSGAMELMGGDYTTGVGRVSNSKAKSTLKTRVKTYEQTIKELFKNFINQINLSFRDIKVSADAISDKLGNDIVYDDDIKLFINIFEGFNSDLNNGKLFYSLISLDQSMAGRELKGRFMDNLKKLIESLSSLEKYNYLSDIKKQLESVKETVETYSDTVLNIRSNEENVKSGNAEFLWSDSLVDPSIPASVANVIKETIIKLKFYGNLSMLKDNLNRVSKEYPALQQDYDKLLGKSIGNKLSDLQKEYTESVDRINDTERGRGLLLKTYNDGRSEDQKIPKGLVETLYKLQYEAKVGLYKTVEAIDLYLMKFTEKVSNDIAALKELDDMIKQTDLISAWYDNNSVSNIDNLYALIRPDADRLLAYEVGVKLNISTLNEIEAFSTGKKIREVLEACKKSVESIAVLKNIISMFVHIGNKFGDKNLTSENHMAPRVMYNNLVKYVWVSAFTMGYGTGGGDKDAVITGEKKGKNGYEKETGDKPSFFDMKMTTVKHPLDLLGQYEKKIKKDIDDAILEIANSGYGNVNALDTNAFNPAAAPAGFANYQGASDFLRRYNTTAQGPPAVLSAAGVAAGTTDPVVQRLLNIVYTNNGRTQLKNAVYIQLKHMKDNLYSKDIFETEDKYFVLAMKAISSKVLTTVGLCNMMQRPRKITSMITNPIRSIIGANEVEVIDGAVELYIRLPLLLEFYKKIFDNGNEKFKKNKHSSDDSETIAFIPEVGSVWSGLIQCVFDDSKQINNGVYSYENMRRIISEVNKIYNKYKGSDEAKLARDVIMDLVAEINKRYGVMKRQEIDEFYQTKKKYVSNMNSISTSPTDFDILDNSDDFEDAGPSSQFVEYSMNLKNNGNKTVQNDIQIVKEFRDKIHNELFNKNFTNIENKSFSERVKYYKNEVKNTSSQKNKVDLILKAIDDSSNIEAHNNDVYLLFHELVAYPLTLLQETFRHNVDEVLKFQINSYHTAMLPAIQSNPLIWGLVNRIGNSMNRPFNRNFNFLSTNALVATELQNLQSEYNSQGLGGFTGFLGSRSNAALAVSTLRQQLASLFDPRGLLGVINPAYQDLLVARGADAAEQSVNAQAAFMTLVGDVAAVNRLGAGIPIRLYNENSAAYGLLTAAGVPQPFESYRDFFRAHLRRFATLRVLITTRRTNMTGPQLPLATALGGDIVNLATSINNSSSNDFQKNVKLQLGIINLLFNNNIQKNNTITSMEETIEKISNLQDPITVSNVSPTSNDYGETHKFYNNSLIQQYCKYQGSFTKEELTTHFISNFNNNLVNIKLVSSNKFILDYSNLQTTTEKCLESIKYNISKLRNQLNNNALISKYENAVNAVEDEFLFKFIYNQDNMLKPVYEILNLENVNGAISSLIQNGNLTVDRNALYRIIVSNGHLIDGQAGNYFDLSNVDAQADIFKNVLKESMKTYMSQHRRWISFNVQNVAAAAGAPAVAGVPTPVNPHFLTVFQGTDTISKENSILIKFNNLVARYLDTFFDVSSKKFYSNLLTEFTKSQNTAIFSGAGLQDIFNENEVMNALPLFAVPAPAAGAPVAPVGVQVPNGTIIFPSNDAVLAESIGFSIRAIMNRMVNKQLQTKYHAQMSLSEVSANMIEKYKAFLPMFISMFEKLCEQSLYIKKFLEMESPSNVNGNNREIDYPSMPVNLLQDEEGELYLLKGKWVYGDSQCYSHFNNILNNIIEASRALINDANNVLKEVDYSPQFFEVKDKSIKNFFSNSNKLPVMPQSILSSYHINCQRSADFPSSDSPDSLSKFYYGSNSVLNTKNPSSDINQFIWLKDFLSAYNSGVQKVNAFDADKLVPYLDSTNKLSKCLFETRVLNKICLQTLFNTGSGGDYNYFKPTPLVGPPLVDHTKLSTYYSSASLSDLLSITENMNTDSGKQKISNHLLGNINAPVYDRESARLMNLVDLNISPINPHALLREIPLINVYNYAFTFDDIVKKEISSVNVEDYTGSVLTRHQAFSALLLDPYFCVNKKVLDADHAAAPGNNSTLGYIDDNNVIANTADINYKTTNTIMISTLENEIPQSGALPFKLGHPRYVKELAAKFQENGQDNVDLRFNNKFTRNVLFLSNLQRFILYKIKSEMENISSKKVNNNHILNTRIVSYDNAAEVNNDDEFSYLMV